MGGAMALPSYGNTLQMFNKLAPVSDILSGDLSKYSESWKPSSHALGVFNAFVSFKFNNKDGAENRNPILRFGITYQGGQLLSKNMQFESRTPYDTLVSSLTGDKTFIDSVYTSTIDMNYRTSQAMGDVAIIWRSNPARLVGFYGGLGFAGGISFDNRTTISHTKNNNISTGRGNYYPGDDNREIFRNENSYSALIYLPLGGSISMSKSGFWKTVNFVFELRPGISVISIPELETNASAVFPVSFGWKLSW